MLLPVGLSLAGRFMAIPVDSRFPNLIRVADVELPHVRRAAMGASRAIVNRTNIGCLYNTSTDGLYFHLQHDVRCGLPIECPILDDGRLNRLSGSDIDDIVRLIYMARMPAQEKNKIEAANKQAEDSRQQKSMESHLAERRPDALSRAEFLSKKRQMGKHFRGAAVVDGLKGA